MRTFKRNIDQLLGFSLMILATIFVLAIIVGLFADMFLKGSQALSFEFVLGYPKQGMTAGGIWPAVFGTVVVTLLSTLIVLPLGIGCAVYLHEYARDQPLTQLIRAAIRNLAGVPSIVYGLFGLTLFVEGMGMGLSVLAAGCTLGMLTLPAVISTTEEALRQVPRLTREGAYALGATQWECIRSVVLPAAVPGISTGAILALSRAAGETAPILFTGVAFYTRYLPGSIWDQFMAMPYHLYILSTQHHDIDAVRPLAYATALLLLVLVLLLNLTAMLIRQKKQ